MSSDIKRQKRAKLYPVKPWVRRVSQIMVFLVIWSTAGVADAVNLRLSKIESVRAAADLNRRLDAQRSTAKKSSAVIPASSLASGAQRLSSEFESLQTLSAMLSEDTGRQDVKIALASRCASASAAVEGLDALLARQRAELVASGAASATLARHDQFAAELSARAAKVTTAAEALGKDDVSAALAPLAGLFKTNAPQALKKAVARERFRSPAASNLKVVRAGAGSSVPLFDIPTSPKASGPPNAADLAVETGADTTFAELAARLGSNPAQIYGHVYNTIRYAPYFGSAKIPAATLASGSGNDADQAALLVALLRSAAIPCRYVHGTVRLPAAAAMSITGTLTPEFAAAAFARAGVPCEAVLEGGKFAAVRVDHVWVAVWAAPIPYLGAAPGEGPGHWVGVDPAFKTNSYSPQRDVAAAVGFDADTLLSAAVSQSTVADSWATNVPETTIVDAMLQFGAAAKSYLAANHLTTANVHRTPTIEADSTGFLPIDGRFDTELVAGTYSAFPAELRHRAAVKLTDDTGATLLSFEADFADLANRPANLSFAPETAADRQTVAANLSNPDFPAYLVRLAPSFEAAGRTVAGTASGMGHKLTLTATLTNPKGETEPLAVELRSGDTVSLLFAANDPVAADVRAAGPALAADAAAGKRSAVAGSLRLAALNYLHQSSTLDRLAAGALQVVRMEKPVCLAASHSLEADEILGAPVTARSGGAALALPAKPAVPVSVLGTAAESRYQILAAITDATAAHASLQRSFAVAAVSAVSAILAANRQGMKVYTADGSNLAAVAAALAAHPESFVGKVRDAVNAWADATVPESPVVSGAWTGSALAAIDRATGASRLTLGSGPDALAPAALVAPAAALSDAPAAAYSALAAPAAESLVTFEDATARSALSYLPAAAAVNCWFDGSATPGKATVIAALIAVAGPISKLDNEPAILNVAAAPACVSPNSDGVNDAFELSAHVTRGASWQVTIADAANQPVYVFAGTNPELAISFGRDVADPADGPYSYKITAAALGVPATPVTGTFKVDKTAPDAALSVRDSTLSGTVALTGSADDLNFDHYAVSLKSAADSAPVELFRSSTPVVGRTLCAIDTTQKTNGPATLYLDVVDQAGNKSAATLDVTIFNAAPDTTAPAVELAATSGGQPVASGATLSADLDVSLAASDNTAVKTLALRLDGAAVATSSNSDTLVHTVAIAALADGAHTLTATAADAAGNVGTLASSFNFTAAAPIHDFKVSPAIATPSHKTVTVTANLRSAAAWTLSFSGSIPTVTGSGAAVSASFDASAYPDGAYTATLAADGATATLPFAIDAAESPTVAAIGNITASQIVREGLFELVGTADDPDVSDAVRHKVTLLDREGNFVSELLPWTDGKVANGPLGTLDFTLTRDGCYTLVLTVDGGGETASARVDFALNSQLKVGQMGFSQQDLVVPAGGQPLTVIRTYNSLNPDKGDFGASWTWAIKDVEMTFHEDRSTVRDVFDQSFSMRDGGSRDIDVTLPDGRRTTFMYELGAPNAANPFALQAYWKAAPGVRATLVPTCSNKLITLYSLRYWEAAGMSTPLDNFDFPGFILTMNDGSQYHLDREDLGEFEVLNDDGSSLYVHAYGAGHLTQITARSGEKTVFNDASIDSFDPQGNHIRSVVFNRGANGLIDAIYDPKALDSNNNPVGPACVTYEYDAQDNLIKVNKLKDGKTTPATYLATEYVYAQPGRPHFITSIKDPRGLTPMVSEYDASGRLVATVDAQGNRVEMQHNLAARSETVLDRQGNPSVYGYDSRGNVTNVTDAQGTTTYHSYDAQDNELTTTDPLGNVTNFTYDSNGNRTSVADPLGNTSTFTFDSYGNQLTSTDPLGNVTTNSYDANGNLTSTTNALGQTTSNAYDNKGNLTQTKDALGQVTATFAYDGQGNMTSTADAAGFARSFSYNSNGEQTGTSYVWEGQTVSTQTIYDDAGQVVKTIDPEGNFSTTEYNELGKLVKTTDKLGNVSTTIYDSRGNVIETRHPDGTISRTVYDENGRAFVSQDRHVPGTQANGSYTFFDSAGKVIKTQRLSNVNVNVALGSDGQPYSEYLGADAAISQSSTTYDKAGRVLKSIDATGTATRYEYDAAGRTLAVIDALNNCTEYEYNAAGQQTLVRDALGREVSYTYDALGRRVKTTFPDGTFATVTYNELGQKTKETDQSGLTTQFTYDTLGHLSNVTKPEVANPENANTLTAPQWSYAYDNYGRLTTITDPKSRSTTFTYDALGRQLSRTLPMGQSESQQYDTFGRLSKKIDFKGHATEMVYDTLGRVNAQNYYATGSTSPDETIQMVYDDLGRQKQIVEARGTTECSYDTNGQMVSVATPEGTIHYEYDPTTGRKLRTWTASSDQRYTYDTLGRLKTVEVHKRNAVQLTNPEITTYSYTAVGSRSGQVLPNGVKTQYTYNDLNRLTTLTHKTASDELLASYAYTLAPNGRRTAIAEQRRESDNTLSATNVAFTYDKLNRLVNEASTSTISTLNFTTSYAYDLNGNRLKKATASDTITYTYNNNDQLIQENSTVDGQTSYAYDANGSQTLKSGTKGVYNYLYNLQNRLSSATIQRTESSHSVNVTASYVYNSSGVRVHSNSVQTVDGAATTNNCAFLVDSNNFTGYAQVFEEFNGVSTAPVKSYTLGDDVLSQCVNGVVGHLLYDGHGSTRMLTANSGAVADRFDFDAYGVQLGQTPNVTAPGSTDMLYSGEQFDPELQQQYLRTRYYDQNIGRFTSLDTFSGNNHDPQSLHKYAYCHADPVNKIDPSGEDGTLISVLCVMAIQSALYTMVLGNVINVKTQGKLFQGLYLTIYYLMEPVTWLLAVTNVIVGLSSFVTDLSALGYLFISIIGNILTGGIFGVCANAYGAIRSVSEFTGIFSSSLTVIQAAKIIAIIIATIVIGLIIAAIVAGFMKFISAIVGKISQDIVKPMVVYRRGSATDSNLTPRPRDIEGLSTNLNPPSGKSQVIDTKLLKELEAIPDSANHVSIRPKDMSKMQSWIDSRGTDVTHEFTEELRNAIIKTENN